MQQRPPAIAASSRPDGGWTPSVNIDSLLGSFDSLYSHPYLARILRVDFSSTASINDGRGMTPLLEFKDAELEKMPVTVIGGAFTRPGAHEAVIASYGGSPTPSVWLLEYSRETWRVVSLVRAGGSRIRGIDLDGNGMLELVVEGSTREPWGEAEEDSLDYAVMSLKGGSANVLYHVTGYDRVGRGNGVDGDSILTHQLAFADVDGDGRIELTDVVRRSWYYNTRNAHKPHYFLEGKRAYDVHAFRFAGGAFLPTTLQVSR